MRTNIEIDDSLMQKAMDISGLKPNKEVLERALTEFVANRSRNDLLDERGKIQFADDYDYKAMREGRS